MRNGTGATRQAGFTLVEIMVAIVLSLLISAAAITLFLQSKRNFNQDELISEMQENGRYAMYVLAGDLAMADFWGGMLEGDAISPAASLTVNPDCGTPVSPATTWAYDTSQAIDYARDLTSPSQFGCIPVSGSGQFKTGTDVLAVKRVAGSCECETGTCSPTSPMWCTSTTTPAALTDNAVYLRTNGTNGTLFPKTSSTPALTSPDSDWEYLVHVYYVRSDGPVPALQREVLESGTPPKMAGESGEIAEGVERFRVQFGIDTDGNMTPNFYTSDPNDSKCPITDPATGEQKCLQNAVSARIYVLVRSRTQDFSYTNTKTYHLGDRTVPSNGQPFNDHYYRRVYVTTVMLRNPAYLHAFPA